MNIKFLIDEDFLNYKKASMFIGFPNCSLKCDKDAALSVVKTVPFQSDCNKNKIK